MSFISNNPVLGILNTRLQNHLLKRSKPAKRQPKKARVERVLDVLRRNGHGDLARKISVCKRGKRCGSYWCPHCRHTSSKELEKRIRTRLERFGGGYENARADLRWVTILNSVEPVYLPNVQDALKSGKKSLRAIARRFPSIWMQGAWELEAIDLDAAKEKGAASTKLSTLDAMLAGLDQPRGQLLLVHCHVLVDLNGTNGQTFTRWLRSRPEWRKHARQVDVRQIYALDKQLAGIPEMQNHASPGQAALDHLAWKLASYVFKDRVQFNESYRADGFNEGGYIPDRTLARLVQYHHTIGKKQLLIGVGSKKQVLANQIGARRRSVKTMSGLKRTVPLHEDVEIRVGLP